jgi:hypothetical protein
LGCLEIHQSGRRSSELDAALGWIDLMGIAPDFIISRATDF